MSWVDDILDEFSGQITPEFVYKSTYKEINYLREHRKEMNSRKNKNDMNGLKLPK